MNSTAHTETYDLRQDLISFGLNPNDWRLVREKEQTYRIESDQDKDFIFLGAANKKKTRWEKIEIFSL